MQAELVQDVDTLLGRFTGRVSGYGEEPTFSLLAWDAERGSYKLTYETCCRFRAVLKEELYQECVERKPSSETKPSQLTSCLLSNFINIILDVDKLQVDTTETTDWKGMLTNECMKVFLDILSTHSSENYEHNPLSSAAMVSEPPLMFGTTLGPGLGTN